MGRIKKVEMLLLKRSKKQSGGNRMKKLPVLLAALLTASLALNACSISGKQNGKSSDNASGNVVEIKYAFSVNSQIPTNMQKVMNEVSKITEKKIGAKITAVPISDSQYAQQINLMISGGEQLDVMTERGQYLSSDVAKNQLKPLDGYLKQNGADAVKALGNYIKVGQINGKQYAVPCIRSMASSYGICMRKDIVDKYNIDITKLKTLDDVAAMFKKVQAGEPNLVMTMSQAQSTPMYSYMYPCDALGDSFGVLTNGGLDNTTVVDLPESSNYSAGIKYIRQWYTDGYILKDNAVNTTPATSMVKSGKVFSFFTSLKPGFDMQATIGAGTQMVTATLLSQFTTTDSVANYSMAIPITCKNTDKTMKFINLMYSDPQVINLFDWGVEGTDYVKDSSSSNVIDYPAGVTAANTGYGLNMGFEFGNQLLSYVWKGNSPDLYTNLSKFNKEAKFSKAYGFMFDSSSVKTEYAALTNVKNQYQVALEDGAVDPVTTLPKYISALKDAGIERYIAEKQKQLNTWLKTQSK